MHVFECTRTSSTCLITPLSHLCIEYTRHSAGFRWSHGAGGSPHIGAEMAVQPSPSVSQKRVAEVIPISMVVYASLSPSLESTVVS